jgi:tyrosinase
MGIRKNQRTLTAAEKKAFVDAVLELKRRGEYDEYVRMHNDFITGDRDNGVRVGHRSPSFLPWHRQYLLDFEQALQRIDAGVSLPYWDWTGTRRTDATLWDADFMGGNGRSGDGQVTTGPFAYDNQAWPLTVRVDDRPYLRRALGVGARALPTATDRDTVLGVATYDEAPWNSTSAGGFRNLVEGWRGPGMHNRVHVWVGGTMATGVSPNDPVFWLHHCYIDKLWADWQARHPESGYLPAAETPDVVDLTETLAPWHTLRPADLLDHTAHYTYA